MKSQFLPKPPVYVTVAIVLCASVGTLLLVFNLVALLAGTLIDGNTFLQTYIHTEPGTESGRFWQVVNFSNFKAAFGYVSVLIIALGLMGYTFCDFARIGRKKG